MAGTAPAARQPELVRRLGTGDAVVIGLGSMIGAGIFAALTPAAEAAGSGLLLSLALAAVVAYCNATSSARLAARYPASGGTYVYGRERLGDFSGYLAGWAFVVGKTASCAAMALAGGDIGKEHHHCEILGFTDWPTDRPSASRPVAQSPSRPVGNRRFSGPAGPGSHPRSRRVLPRP